MAAGNLGPRTLTFPASVSGVVAVTGYDDDGVLPQCSALADLAAPGRDVPAAGWGRLVRSTAPHPPPSSRRAPGRPTANATGKVRSGSVR